MTLTELIETSSDITNDLRRAFRPLSPHIDITGNESTALIILANLTAKTLKQNNLLDKDNCLKLLRDNDWWSRCINTVKFRHSHNVKFPNIMAIGIIRALPIGEIPRYLLSSSKLEKHAWAYSKNAKDVNISSFLTSEFVWQGKICCLGILLSDENHHLWEHLKKLGCYQKTRQLVVKQLKKIPKYHINTSLSDNYIKQVSFPDGEGSYLSLSPVTSQTMQNDCCIALNEQYRLSKIMRVSRVTNMGVLPISCSGALRMLSHTVNFGLAKHYQKTTHHYWLDKDSIKAFYDFSDSSNWLMPRRQKQIKIDQIKDTIAQMLSRWLASQNNIHQHNNLELIHKLNNELSKIQKLRKFAYEPKVSKLLLGQIEKARNTQQTHTPPNEHFNKQLLLLPNLSVCGASASSSSVTIGMPAMTAFYGFIHAFERKLQPAFPNIKIDSFALCIHSFHLQKRGLTREYVNKTNGNISPPATHDEWLCDFNASLILNITNCSPFNEKMVLRAIPKRLAGGSVKISINDIKNIELGSSFIRLVERIPCAEGKWLTLSKEPIQSFDDISQQIKKSQQHIPTNIGYHYLEFPCERPFALRKYKHAFVEPIIGLIKLISINDRTSLNDLFWYQINKPNYTTIETRDKHNEATNSPFLRTLNSSQ